MKPAQMVFDYRELEPEDRAYVKEREEQIRGAVKVTAQGIVKIGQWLSEVKERLPHGKWLPWLKVEFGWTDRTARNFMSVHQAFKSETVSNLTIDVSALYLIAAPATPEPVVRDVIERAKRGEPMTKAKAKKVLADYKKRVEAPTPAVARQIAIATGKPTVASNNTVVMPMSAEAERAGSVEQNLICNLYQNIEDIAGTTLSPADMVVLGKKYACHDLLEFSLSAAAWLSAVASELRSEKDQTAAKRIS